MRKKECVAELKPDSILKHFQNHPSVVKAFSKENLSALDVGCRVPCPLFVIYHDFNFTLLKGIELSSESDAVKSFLKDAKAENLDLKTIYDVYLKDLKLDEEDIRLGKQLVDEITFKKHFKILFNLPADWYFTKVQDTTMFDYVILSNVLHLNLEPTATTIFEGAIARLKSDGLIFVRVNHRQNPVAKKLRHRTYGEREFKKLFAGFNEILFCKDKNDNNTGFKSMIFFGSKK